MKFKRKSKTVNKPRNSPAVTFITKNTEIKADIQCDDDIRIAGSIEGEVESKQKLILNNSGKIKGTIIAPVADISGKIIGDVRATNKLTLRSTAVIDGQIFTKKLAIEDGAQLKGSLQVGPDIDVKKKGSQQSPASPSLLKKAESRTQKTKKDEPEDTSKSKTDASDSSSDSSKLSA